jgi:K+-transporting ATPase ATPase A chain
MNTTLTAVLSILTVLAILAVIHVPLGTWIHRIFTDTHHTRVERFLYRLVGVDPDVEQRWSIYAISVVAFSVVSILVLWLLILVQGSLPLSQGRSMNPDTAFNTAVSFVTNTNWQSYAGEAGRATWSRRSA